MTSSISKDRTVAALGEVWASLGELLSEIADADWLLPSPLPGWSVQDNVSHIIGTEEMLLGRPSPEVEIDREATPHIRNDIGAFNEAWVASLRTVGPGEVLAHFREVTATRLADLEKLSDDEWIAESFTPVGKSTYGRFMQIRAFDCWLHEQDIRDALNRPGHENGLAVEVALSELKESMGFLVGKRAGAKEGESVTFLLTEGGGTVCQINVEVAGRATVVDDLSGPATVTLTMPVGVMMRRCGGRVGPEELLDQVAIEGDAELAARIFQHQAYMI